MKCHQTDSVFKYTGDTILNVISKGDRIRPFNGEDINQPSWSHGYTHYHNLSNPSQSSFCGVDWFEYNMEVV